MSREAKVKKKLSLSNRIFYIFNTVFWIMVMLIILYPLYLVLIASVSDPDAIVRGGSNLASCGLFTNRL